MQKSTAQDAGKKRSNNQNIQIAIVLIDENKEDSALVHLNNVLSRVYDHQLALKLRAKIYHNKGQFDKSFIDYNALAERYPDDREIRYGLALARQNLSQYKLAIEDYLAAMELPDIETNTAFFRIDPAENMATGISTMSGMDTDILNNIGLCFHELGNYGEALHYYNEALSHDPKALHILVNRAKSYEAKGENKLAIQDYETVLTQNPAHAIASYNLLQIQKNQQTDHELQQSLDQYILDNPDIAHGYVSRGLYYYDHQQYKKALSDFHSAVRLDPINIDYKFNLALAMEKNNQLSLAEIQFLEVLELDPKHSGAFFNLGNLHFKSNRFDKAIPYYTMAHYHNPQNIFILYNRALAYFKNNQLSEACADMNEVLKVDQSLAAEFYKLHCSTP